MTAEQKAPAAGKSNAGASVRDNRVDRTAAPVVSVFGARGRLSWRPRHFRHPARRDKPDVSKAKMRLRTATRTILPAIMALSPASSAGCPDGNVSFHHHGFDPW
jgi:hypothetical protein